MLLLRSIFILIGCFVFSLDVVIAADSCGAAKTFSYDSSDDVSDIFDDLRDEYHEYINTCFNEMMKDPKTASPSVFITLYETFENYQSILESLSSIGSTSGQSFSSIVSQKRQIEYEIFLEIEYAHTALFVAYRTYLELNFYSSFHKKLEALQDPLIDYRDQIQEFVSEVFRMPAKFIEFESRS